jgi:Tannase and feruloyl esterase
MRFHRLLTRTSDIVAILFTRNRVLSMGDQRLSSCWIAAALCLAAQVATTGEVEQATPLRCERLLADMTGHWPDASTRLSAARWNAAGPVAMASLMPGPPQIVSAPEHCELTGIMQQRTGAYGQNYAIRFHLRLPAAWNGRFLFQGGGGSDGVLGDALGVYAPAAKPALLRGFAVVSQDAGHDNAVNNDPARSGMLTFGFDAQARANYGRASLPLVAEAAKAVIGQFYGAAAKHSYFVGCSKGGEEGMALAQRYASQFDGIAVGDPGMSLPRAAVAEAWNTQAFAQLIPAPNNARPLSALSSVFSNEDMAKVRTAVLAACDAADGLKDGIIGDFKLCTTDRVRPVLEAERCKGSKNADCLSAQQIEALVRVMQGAHNSRGEALYSAWPWDAGIAAPGWRVWEIGLPGGPMPSLNVILGGNSLATVFMTPPTPLPPDPQAAFDFLLRVDFDRDAARINATDPQFGHSAWADISARSADLSAFHARGGKMIVFHGVSDPVFSINDTIDWWRELNRDNAGRAAGFVRLFPVPGMNHCGGGDATDQFDVLAPLMQWVEQGLAPDRIIAGADPAAPWPKRTRPLCPYPQVARYRGTGDVEQADAFVCGI